MLSYIQRTSWFWLLTWHYIFAWSFNLKSDPFAVFITYRSSSEFIRISLEKYEKIGLFINGSDFKKTSSQSQFFFSLIQRYKILVNKRIACRMLSFDNVLNLQSLKSWVFLQWTHWVHTCLISSGFILLKSVRDKNIY